MLCDECKKRPACVHITKIINNQKMEKRLCELCAQKSGDISPALQNTFSVHDFLKGMFSHAFVEGNQVKNEAACPSCGMTYSDFSHNGKIGCGTCYTTFAVRLEQILKRIHGATAHTGKYPKRTGGMLEIKQRLSRLKQELEQVVAREEYEQAAKIRDEIKALEKNYKLNNEGEGKLCQ